MKLTEKQFIYLSILTLVASPLFFFLFNLISVIQKNSPDYTALMYLKQCYVPFYFSNLFQEDNFRVSGNIFHFLLESKIESLIFFPILPILVLIGIYRKKYNKIIHFGLALKFIYILFTLPNLFYQDYNIYFVIFINLLELIIVTYLLNYIKTRTDIVSENDNDENLVAIDLNKKDRFINYLIDRFIIFHLCCRILLMIQVNKQMDGNMFKFLKFENQNLYILSLTLFSIFFYYTIFEGIFKTTIGKIVTNSTIINEDGNLISFGKAIARTFYRILPFEALNYLIFYNLWHDKYTITYVVKMKYKNDK
jgi:uncharacterized RDD family membrane protein YckC